MNYKFISIIYIKFILILLSGCGEVTDINLLSAKEEKEIKSDSNLTKTLSVKLTHGKLELNWTEIPNTKFYMVHFLTSVPSVKEIDIATNLENTNYNFYYKESTYSLALWELEQAIIRITSCKGIGNCVEVYTSKIDTIISGIEYIKYDGLSASAEFGSSLSISADGRTLAIGAPYNKSAGLVLIYSQNDIGHWQEKFVINNRNLFDSLGSAVAISADGKTLAMAAPFEDGGTKGINQPKDKVDIANSGAVYVFTQNEQGEWSISHDYIKASNTDFDDNFGSSISLSEDGNTLAVGAIYEDSNAKFIDGSQGNHNYWYDYDSGAVYVYKKNAQDEWLKIPTYLKANNTDADDEFGSSVSLSADGKVIAISAPKESSNAVGIDADHTNNDAILSGAVYIYSQDSYGEWQFLPTYIKASNTGIGDRFGYAVSLSADGNKLAVGAPFEDGTLNNQNDFNNSLDHNSGAVYIFSKISNGTWQQEAYLKASNGKANDWFGYSIDLSGDGNTLIVGAVAKDGKTVGLNNEHEQDIAINSGAVYIFNFDKLSGTWQQSAHTQAINAGGGDWFGYSVAVNYSGKTIAVGAPNKDSNGSNQLDHNNSLLFNQGAVYIY